MTQLKTVVSLSDLRGILMGATAQTIVSVVALTEPFMRAKDAEGNPNPFRIGKGKTASMTIRKIVKINGLACPNYDRIVIGRNKRDIIAERIAAELPPLSEMELIAEAESRHAKGVSWHRPILDTEGRQTTLCCHKDAEDDAEAEVYLRFMLLSKGKAEYRRIADASTVADDEVYPYLSASSSGNGFLTYALSSIAEIAIDGKRYRVAENTAEGSSLAQTVAAVADEYLEGLRRLSAVAF
jgi:hypothetical protein